MGKPLFLTQLKLGENQEILIKTPALTKGYLNRSNALESKKTSDGWYKTGDIGHLDNDGFLYVDGRIDDMIIFAVRIFSQMKSSRSILQEKKLMK